MQVEAAPQAGPSTTGSGEPGRGGSAAPIQTDIEEQHKKQEAKSQQHLNANPYRSLGDALEHWRADLSVTRDANQQNQVCWQFFDIKCCNYSILECSFTLCDEFCELKTQ